MCFLVAGLVEHQPNLQEELEKLLKEKEDAIAAFEAQVAMITTSQCAMVLK